MLIEWTIAAWFVLRLLDCDFVTDVVLKEDSNLFAVQALAFFIDHIHKEMVQAVVFFLSQVMNLDDFPVGLAWLDLCWDDFHAIVFGVVLDGQGGGRGRGDVVCGFCLSGRSRFWARWTCLALRVSASRDGSFDFFYEVMD